MQEFDSKIGRRFEKSCEFMNILGLSKSQTESTLPKLRDLTAGHKSLNSMLSNKAMAQSVSNTMVRLLKSLLILIYFSLMNFNCSKFMLRNLEAIIIKILISFTSAKCRRWSFF